jgi:hypothetical protein
MKGIAYTFAAVLAVGCSSVQVRSTEIPNANLAQRRTFAFMTPVRPDVPAAEWDQSPAGQQIHRQIAQDLIAKGYTPAAPGTQPDFLVAYRTQLRERTEVTNWGYGGDPWAWGWGWGGWAWDGPDVSVRQYTEGTLVVDFVDPTTHRALWRGTAVGVVNHPENPNPDKVAKAVNKLMRRLPATGLASTNAGTRM